MQVKDVRRPRQKENRKGLSFTKWLALAEGQVILQEASWPNAEAVVWRPTHGGAERELNLDLDLNQRKLTRKVHNSLGWGWPDGSKTIESGEVFVSKLH